MIKKTILVNKLNFYKNKRSIQKKNVYQKEKNYKIQLSNNSMLSDKIFLKKQITHVHFWDSMPNLVTQVGRFEVRTSL
jgi:hypothetical protein